MFFSHFVLPCHSGFYFFNPFFQDNRNPTFVNPPTEFRLKVGVLFSVQILATDGNNDNLTFSLTQSIVNNSDASIDPISKFEDIFSMRNYIAY